MPISCALGLAACLHYKGQVIHVDDAIAAMDLCELQERRLTETGITALADRLSRLTGVRISWPPHSLPTAKMGAIRRECVELRRAFNTESSWDNLEKWPY